MHCVEPHAWLWGALGPWQGDKLTGLELRAPGDVQPEL